MMSKNKKAFFYVLSILAVVVLIFVGMILQIINKNDERIMKIKLRSLQRETSRLSTNYNDKELKLKKLLSDEYVGLKAKKMGFIYPQKQCRIVSVDNNGVYKNEKIVKRKLGINLGVDKALADEKIPK